MKRHITLKDFIIDEDIEDWNERTERLQRNYVKQNFHEGSLGSPFSDAQRTFALAVMGNRPHQETLDFLTQSKDLGIAHLVFGNNPGKEVELKLFNETYHTTGVNEGAFMNVAFWNDVLSAAIICRDAEGKDFLRSLDNSVFENANIKPDELDLLFVRIQKGMIGDDPQLAENLEDMITAIHSGQMDKAKLPYRQKMVLPFLKLYQSILANDSDKFNSDLNSALQMHQTFWSTSDREYKPDGWVSIPLLTTCSLAFDKGINITVSSEYIPEWLYRAEF
jgi:hypothetical protein